MDKERYATFWARARAAFIDGLIFWPLTFGGRWIFDRTDGGVIPVLWYILMSGLPIAYSVLFHAATGQTIGKRVVNIRVVDRDEYTPVTLAQAVKRDIGWMVLATFSLLTELGDVAGGVNPLTRTELTAVQWVAASGTLIWVAAELLTMLANERRRALHDVIAGTVVMRTGLGPRPKKVYEAGSSGLPFA
jgi:uncharacterized RDD family membrane protein YckC